MLAFLTGFFKRLKASPVHRHMSHEQGLRRLRVIPTPCDRLQVATVEQNTTRHAFLTGVSSGEGPFLEQLEGLLRDVRDALTQDDVACPAIVRQSIFLSDVGQLQASRELIRRFFGESAPITTFIPQTPCSGAAVAIEVTAVDCEAELTRCGENLTVERHDGVTWIHGAQIVSEPARVGVYDRSFSAFLQMRNLLKSENVAFPHVLRTWLYLGDIVGDEGDVQRYKELNRARTDFFEGVTFSNGWTPSVYRGAVYPASTGIGADDTDVTMGVIALKSDRDDIIVVPLENPDQTSAFDYAECYSPKSPKFARAMAVMVGQCGTIFVSGTASITEAESRHIEDIEKQTHQTIDNMACLIDEANLKAHGIEGQDASVQDFAVVRAYIKRAGDYPKVRAICEERFGPIPTIYTVADVCRPELLVEIEGIAFPRVLTSRTEM